MSRKELIDAGVMKQQKYYIPWFRLVAGATFIVRRTVGYY